MGGNIEQWSHSPSDRTGGVSTAEAWDIVAAAREFTSDHDSRPEESESDAFRAAD